MEGSAHYEGRAIDVFFRPISDENKKRGWAMAYYLVANADRLDIKTVIFDDRIWRAGSWSGDGWATTACRRRHAATGRSWSTATTCTSTSSTEGLSPSLSRPGDGTAAATRSSVAVKATRTCWRPVGP